jgi:hypothetical protein
MRARTIIAPVLALAALFAAPAARADREPVIVYPGRPGVPVMWFGRDISGAVIEGDWGLDRPGHGQITILPAGRHPIWVPSGGGYFPTTGRPPRYGRDEKEPPPDRAPPQPAESYHRSWGAQSMPLPATMPPDYEQPPMVVVPQINGSPYDNNNNNNRPRPMPRPAPRRY